MASKKQRRPKTDVNIVKKTSSRGATSVLAPDLHPQLFATSDYPVQYQRRDPAYVGEIRGIYGDAWRPSSSLFGARGGHHKGVDIYAPVGHPVVAIVDGEVEFKSQADHYDDLGNRAWLWFAGADGKRWRFLYGHLDRFEGADRSVRRGTIIGYVGCSGNADYDGICRSGNRCGMYSSHCHLALRNGSDKPIDPLDILPWRLRYANDIRDLDCGDLRAVSTLQLRTVYERQRLIIDQLQQLESFSKRPETRAWRRTLLAQLEEGARLADYPGNVDTAAKAPVRVAALVALLDRIVAVTDASSNADVRINIRNFLLHVAWHESAKLTRRSQMNGGPARSFFQLEAPRAKDAVEYAKTRSYLDEACAEANISTVDIEKAAKDLKPGIPAFPAKNLLGERLADADAFSIWLVRCVLMRISAPIPTGNRAHAEYWYAHWKVTGGDADALKKTFARSADEVDMLLP